MRIIVVAVLGLACALVPAGALELTFRATTGTTVTDFTETIRAVPGGFRATVKSPLEQSSMEMDGSLQTLAWTFRVPADQTEITARLTGRSIAVSGRFKGKPLETTFDTGGSPWYEYQELALDTFATGPAQSIRFVTIDRLKMKLVRFRARKTGQAQIFLQGKIVQALEAVLFIEGIPELFLRSRLWLRQADGRYLRLIVPPFTGIGASTLIELAAETGSLTE
jgi:hypothetical protein